MSNGAADYIVLAGGVASAVLALAYALHRFYKWAREAAAWIQRLAVIVERELTPDSGHSMKDVSDRLKHHLEESALDRADLHRRVDAVVRRARRLHPETDWRAADKGDLEE